MVSRVSSQHFVGREAELGALVRTVRGGGPNLLIVVAGEAGIGKTRFLTEAALILASPPSAEGRRPVRILTGTCLELASGSIPFSPILEFLEDLAGDSDTMVGADARDLLAELGGAHPTAPGTPTEAGQAIRFGRLRDLLVAVGTREDVVLVIDDLHWADASTLDALRYLTLRLRDDPVRLVVAYRSDAVHRRHPLQPWLVTMERRDPVERIALGPLDDQAVAAQIAGIVGENDPSLQTTAVAAVVRAAEGNPFYVEELVASGPDSRISPSLRSIILDRLADLDRLTLDVLRVAAVIGRDWDHRLLDAAIDDEVSASQARDALREASGRFLVEPAPDGQHYRFRHALLREAVYDELLPGDRGSLHRRVADALAAHPDLAAAGAAAAAAERAHHLAASHQPAEAFVAFVAAGRAAEAASAWTEAQGAFERALELELHAAPSGGAEPVIDPVALRRSVGYMAFMAGRPRYALEAVRGALALARTGGDPADLIELLALSSYLASECGEWAEMEVAAEEAYAAAGPEPTLDRLRGLGILGGVRMQVGRNVEATALLTEAVALGRTLGTREADLEVAGALGFLAITQAVLGDIAGALDAAEEAERVGLRLGNADTVSIGVMNRIEALLGAGRYTDARRAVDDGMAMAHRLGIEASLAPWLQPAGAMAEFWLGNWDAAATRLRSIDEPDAELASTQHLSHATTTELVAGARGDAAAADRAASLADRVTSTALANLVADLRHAAALAYLAKGRPDDALDQVHLGLDALVGTDFSAEPAWLLGAGLRSLAGIAERERALGREVGSTLDEIEAMLARLGTYADGSFASGATGVEIAGVILALGVAEASRGRGDAEPAPWSAAVRVCELMAMPYLAAYASFRLAGATLRKGDVPAASGQLRHAARIAEALGASPLGMEVEGMARRARIDLDGPTVVSGGTRVEPPRPWGLSPRELEVLPYLVDGRTNAAIGAALFISEKTVSVHVTHILDKLEVSSRVEAALLAARAGIEPPPT